SLKIGASYIPVATDTPPDRVLKVIDLAEATLTLTHQHLATKLPKNHFPIHAFEQIQPQINQEPVTNVDIKIAPEDIAYIMFTSGSTGEPKGVMISQQALANYINSAAQKYVGEAKWTFPLFSRIGFDLTVTSLFLPLVSGGTMRIYEEPNAGPDLAILEVIEDNAVDFIKLTPSHLSLLNDKDLKDSKIKCMIVGGEDFKMNLALQIKSIFPAALKIYNEYGPTEATVGCIVHQLEVAKDRAKTSVPIGVPLNGMQAYILDQQLNPVPRGVVGELYVSGVGLATAYWKKAALTAEKFIPHPFLHDAKMYQTGDLAKMNAAGQLEYLGRRDEQVKIGGIRVELGEIEAALSSYPNLQNVVVDLWDKTPPPASDDVHYCTSCGLPSNYPNVKFDEQGVCNFCHSFDTFQKKAHQYFKTIDDLKAIFTQAQVRKTGKYDCMMLLSGGKDSTYALGQLVELGYNVLAFTLDNGYISQQALDNVRRVAKEIGVDCVVGETPAMNEVFVDSLHRHCNVCNGCFKVIYTLSTQIAVEKGIPIIVTGLSRGQFFETRLTEELFWGDKVDVEAIDQIILNARKEYHRVDDAVKRLMDVSMFEDDAVFDQVQYVDFYRYTDVTLGEMYEYLDKRLPWVRPTDTGRSTNCLINKLGIHVHTKEQGYSNYAFPYSWDVRMGHKQRDMAIDEINEPIDVDEVTQMMREIGYVPPSEQDRKELLAFYSAPSNIAEADLKQHLAKSLPAYMIPNRFQRVEEFPLNPNGKIDRKALRDIRTIAVKTDAVYVAPSNEFEEILAEIWSTVLELEQVGIHDDFLALGGNSLEAIRVMARTNEAFELELPISLIFEKPTIAEFAAEVERIIVELLAEV
ncbi:MAG: amino acid adenylation domain-containing protein, partial [Bacteroidota bacterium]